MSMRQPATVKDNDTDPSKASTERTIEGQRARGGVL
jgi:hypothetical protein